MARNRHNRHTLAWFLIGVGVGSIVSLLLAPAAGDDLREQLASSVREGAHHAKQRSREAVKTLSDFADSGRAKAKEIIDQGRDFAEDTSSQARDYVQRGRDAASEKVDNL
jgi:gas vesicle protein